MRDIPYQNLCQLHRLWRQGANLELIAGACGLTRHGLRNKMLHAGLNMGRDYLDSFPVAERVVRYSRPKRNRKAERSERTGRIEWRLTAGQSLREIAGEERVTVSWVSQVNVRMRKEACP